MSYKGWIILNTKCIGLMSLMVYEMKLYLQYMPNIPTTSVNHIKLSCMSPRDLMTMNILIWIPLVWDASVFCPRWAWPHCLLRDKMLHIFKPFLTRLRSSIWCKHNYTTIKPSGTFQVLQKFLIHHGCPRVVKLV